MSVKSPNSQNIMSQVSLTNPVNESVGGFRGHIFRRSVHLLMFLFPLMYYVWGVYLENLIGVDKDVVVIIVVLIAGIGETIRVNIGFTIFGQRDYESKQVSALAWGGLSIGTCLLFAPKGGLYFAYIGLPIIFSLTFIDPYLGELRRLDFSSNFVMSSGLILAWMIWFACWNCLGTPWWIALIMGPITIASEWPRFKWIDDNATMVLFPLIVALMLSPFY